MAILFGEDGREGQRPQGDSFGARMGVTGYMPLEGACGIALDEEGQTAYIAAKGCLEAVDLRNPSKPGSLGRLPLQGNGRQVALGQGIACVTAREDGLFVCDVSNPAAPALLAHYDTAELATGICVSGAYCFVACRHMGVEIIDISAPSSPRHVASVLAGEAQSVYARDGLMLVGAWVERQVIVFDIRDIQNPRRLSACELDGYADGICMRGNLCYAATGHHARRLKNRVKYANAEYVSAEMLEDGYGCGHGLELFDLSDPVRPRFLSRVKAPPFFYGAQDMWSVYVWGNTAYLASSWMGVFAIDVADKSAPRITTHYRLPPVYGEAYPCQASIQQLCAPVNGIAAGGGQLYAVSLLKGLYIIDHLNLLGGQGEPQAGPSLKPGRLEASSSMREDPRAVFRVGGQAHGVAFDGDCAVVAAGTEGLFLLEPRHAWRAVGHAQTKGFAMDVRCGGGVVFAACGRGGFSILRREGAGLLALATMDFEAPVRQVVLFRGNLAALQLGTDSVAFVDVSDPAAPGLLCVHDRLGMLYYKNIVRGLYEGRFAVVTPLAPKTVYFDLSNPSGIRRIDCAPERLFCPLEDGMAIDGRTCLTLAEGAFTIAGRGMEPASVPGMELKGWPFLREGILYLVNRREGTLTVIDIRQEASPRWLRTYEGLGHPEEVSWFEGKACLPCGHQGLLVLEDA